MLKRSLAMRITALLVIGAFAAIALWGCSDSDVTSPTVADQADENFFNASNPSVREVMDIQDAHTAALMANPNVIGTATT